jgi:hypothetical protein
MAACYFDQGMSEEATFSLFIRNYSLARGYFVSAGLDEKAEYFPVALSPRLERLQKDLIDKMRKRESDEGKIE